KPPVPGGPDGKARLGGPAEGRAGRLHAAERGPGQGLPAEGDRAPARAAPRRAGLPGPRTTLIVGQAASLSGILRTGKAACPTLAGPCPPTRLQQAAEPRV